MITAVIQIFFMIAVQGIEWFQPGIQIILGRSVNGCGDTTTVGMARDDDVIDLENIDGKLNGSHAAGVLHADDIGNIAIDQHIARLGPSEQFCWHPAVTTTNP